MKRRVVVNELEKKQFDRRIWQQITAPRIGLLHELANKLLSEVENITGHGSPVFLGNGFNLDDQLEKFEIEMIRLALHLSKGRQNEAARLLGIKKTTLHAKIKRHRLDAAGSNQKLLQKT